MTEFDAIRLAESALKEAEHHQFPYVRLNVEAFQLLLDRATGKGERAPM